MYNEKMDFDDKKKNLLMGISVFSVVLLILLWLFFFWTPSFFDRFSGVEESGEKGGSTEQQKKVIEYQHTENPDVIKPEDEKGEVEESEIKPEYKKEEPRSFLAEKKYSNYIEVTDSCGPYFEGECLNVRSGPGLEFSVVGRLREGQVLKIESDSENEEQDWHKVVFDEWIRYPERLSDEWYVADGYVDVLFEEETHDLKSGSDVDSEKRIVIVRSEQKLYAYEREEVFMKLDISTGISLTPTPRGNFRIFRKTPSRYMQGPLPGISSKYWDLPGVPWNLYFTKQGAVIHGAYWHDKFGHPYSNGCVNVKPKEAKKLYDWADLGTEVIVQDY
ncbi:MAG: L,D-transpeptidase family protein [Patescibacteria group bacterium]